MQTIKDLLADVPMVGTIRWIGVADERRAAIVTPQEAQVTPEVGLVDDHHARSHGAKRQVTLLQWEHIPVVASLLNKEVTPAMLRRNLVVSGINLQGLRKARFQIGDVVLQGTGSCPPCSRMNENLGPGGYHAMVGHGGITATCLQGGAIKLGDEVRLLEAAVE